MTTSTIFEKLLKIQVYCPKQFDQTILAYLNLGFKVLMLLNDHPILFEWGQKQKFNPIYLSCITDARHISIVHNDVRYKGLGVLEYTLKRELWF